MKSHTKLLFAVSVAALLCSVFLFAPLAGAQQTLGGITGTVSDPSSAALPGTTVTIIGDEPNCTHASSDTGSYLFADLPIGNYTITFALTGFQTLNIPSIQVQANRTVTVNGVLKVGEVSQTVTVVETPLVNAVDTTNGYVMDKSVVDSVPCPRVLSLDWRFFPPA